MNAQDMETAATRAGKDTVAEARRIASSLIIEEFENRLRTLAADLFRARAAAAQSAHDKTVVETAALVHGMHARANKMLLLVATELGFTGPGDSMPTYSGVDDRAEWLLCRIKERNARTPTPSRPKRTPRRGLAKARADGSRPR